MRDLQNLKLEDVPSVFVTLLDRGMGIPKEREDDSRRDVWKWEL